MGIFSRRTTNAGDQALPRHQRDVEKHRKSHQRYSIESGHLNVRPSFGQWLKMTWLDIVTMICMGAIGLGVYMVSAWPLSIWPEEMIA